MAEGLRKAFHIAHLHANASRWADHVRESARIREYDWLSAAHGF
jgi:hypothetical protein